MCAESKAKRWVGGLWASTKQDASLRGEWSHGKWRHWSTLIQSKAYARYDQEWGSCAQRWLAFVKLNDVADKFAQTTAQLDRRDSVQRKFLFDQEPWRREDNWPESDISLTNDRWDSWHRGSVGYIDILVCKESQSCTSRVPRHLSKLQAKRQREKPQIQWAFHLSLWWTQPRKLSLANETFYLCLRRWG